MDLKHLRHLIALADERHFARAAERVHLSQPAFSRSILAVEQEAGMRLFERDIGDIRPTPAGEFLIERARRLLAEARRLDRDMDLYRDNQLGELALGAGPLAAATFLPQALTQLRHTHPLVDLRIDICNVSSLLKHLDAEEIEFFLADITGLSDNLALEVHPLGPQRCGFFVRPEHPLNGRPCTFAEMWIYGTATTYLPIPAKMAIGKKLGMPALQEATLALECDDFSILKEVIQTTDLVLLANDAIILRELTSGTLVPLEISDPPSLLSMLGVVYLKNRSLSGIAQHFIDGIRLMSAHHKTAAGKITIPKTV